MHIEAPAPELRAMAAPTVFLILGLALGVEATQVQESKLRRQEPQLKGSKGLSFVRAVEFKHRLRVCNAYPYGAAMDVFRSKTKLTGDSPMPYKKCEDFETALKPGDKLEFKVGDANAGTFSVSDLPDNDAVLFLAIHRHDTLSTAVSFESHVFANLLNAQVAIIDTYKGTARSMPEIMDPVGGRGERSEELRFDSVVAVNPGNYEIALRGSDGSIKAKSSLVALNRESYVVMRTGVEAQQGPTYPEELVVFPRSDPHSLHSSAATHTAIVSVILAAIATMASVA